jgi:D-serine deaminase-like pyridoxal phosphate-dependent protein
MITNFTAGDSQRFTQFYPEYPSSAYVGVLYLNGPGTLTVNGVSSITTTDAYDFVIAASQTTFLKSGVYTYSVRVISGIDAYTVESGRIQVAPNLAVEPSRELICDKMIALIEKALTNQLSSGEAVESISIAGRSLTMMSRNELLIERGFWAREKKAILNSSSRNAGIKQIGIII